MAIKMTKEQKAITKGRSMIQGWLNPNGTTQTIRYTGGVQISVPYKAKEFVRTPSRS